MPLPPPPSSCLCYGLYVYPHIKNIFETLSKVGPHDSVLYIMCKNLFRLYVNQNFVSYESETKFHFPVLKFKIKPISKYHGQVCVGYTSVSLYHLKSGYWLHTFTD